LSRAAAMKSLAECRLYGFVDAAYLDGRPPPALAEALCLGGADIIQFRAKDWDAGRVLATARELQPILREHGVLFVVNDHPDIAQSVGADICHLGQEDFAPFKNVRELERPGLRIGLSTHGPDQARRSLAANPDYIAIGPVYATGTKPGAMPVTLDYVRWAAANVAIPWFAIGGITLQNLSAVLEAGATRICVVSAILRSPDVRETCRVFKERVLEGSTGAV